MRQSVTIRQLDTTATEWIEQEARRTGMPVEDVVRQLIYRGLEVERQKTRRQRYHDLDALAGTWNAEEADEFRHAIADLNQIDPSLWQ
jgi:spore germination cell wall hydrolase CwlJ-like protein